MGEGTGEEKIRREDGDGKVRLGECQADHKSNDFMLEIVGSFLFYPRVSLRLDHNSDHKGGKAACSCPERMKMQNRSPCQARCSGRGCGFQVWEGSGLSPGGSACSAA